MSLGAAYLRIVLSRWRLVAALVAACTTAAWAISVFYLAQRPTFEAAARLNIVPTAEELGYASRFVRGSTFDGGSVLLGTYAEFARTRPVIEPIVDRFIAEQAAAEGISVPAWLAAHRSAPSFSPGRILAILNFGEAPVVPLRDELVEEVLEGTTIETVEGTYLIRLAVEWDDPKVAAWIANALADAIIARAETASRSTGRELAGTLETALNAKRDELAAVLRRSRDLKASIGIVDLDRQKQSLLEARLTEQAALTTDRAALDSAQSQVSALRRQAGGKLSSAQTTLEQTLAVEAPRAAGLARSVAVREARLRQLDAQIAGLGGHEDQVKALDDRATALQAEVTALTERVSFSTTENLANAPRIQLIERATAPLVRSSPKIFVNTVLGFIAGCALAACALLLLGPAPARTRSREDDAATAEPEPIEPADAPRPIAAVVPIRPDQPSTTGRPLGTAAAAALAAASDEHDTNPADLFFPHALPRPVDGATYSEEELAALERMLRPWLSHTLADGDALAVAALRDDADARHLAQLLHGLLRRAGTPIQVIDGTRALPRRVAPGKAFIYLGSLRDRRRDVLDALPAGTRLVLACAPADAAEWRARAGASAAVPPAHVVAFQG